MKHLFITTFVLTLCLFITNPLQIAQADEQKNTTKELVTKYAQVYNVNSKVMLAMMRCESSGNQSAIGDGGRAKGLYQYHTGTWERIENKLGKDMDINSEHDQVHMTAYALSQGMGSQWTSYRAIKNGGTYSFYSRLMKQHYTVKCSV